MWLLTRPLVFGLTVYPALRVKLLLGQSLMDSKVGNELLEEFSTRPPKIERFTNLQAAMGLLQLQHVDAFNEGARNNAQALTDQLGHVEGIGVPSCNGEDHIYVYYPLTVDPKRRDALRHHLLKHGIDSKNNNLIVVVTTNNVSAINRAMLRPGRLDAVGSVDWNALESLAPR